MDEKEKDRKLTPELKESAKERPRIDLSTLTGRDIELIRDDLVRTVIDRARQARDQHSSHGNTHSSNNSAGAI